MIDDTETTNRAPWHKKLRLARRALRDSETIGISGYKISLLLLLATMSSFLSLAPIRFLADAANPDSALAKFVRRYSPDWFADNPFLVILAYCVMCTVASILIRNGFSGSSHLGV